ncbi:hypothetical protein SLE2022_115320 [Rubroshorea leprosula]
MAYPHYSPTPPSPPPPCTPVPPPPSPPCPPVLPPPIPATHPPKSSPPKCQLPPPPTPFYCPPSPKPKVPSSPGPSNKAPPPELSDPPSPVIVSPPPGSNRIIIIAVCVSLAGTFFLAFLPVGLFYLAKKKKKKPEAADGNEPHEVTPRIIPPGSCEEQPVTVIEIEDDVVVHASCGRCSC